MYYQQHPFVLEIINHLPDFYSFLPFLPPFFLLFLSSSSASSSASIARISPLSPPCLSLPPLGAFFFSVSLFPVKATYLNQCERIFIKQLYRS